MIGTILLFLVLLSLLVFVHEFGHFIMAKKMGMKVEEFGFGFPPRLWGYKKGETTYSINWIPLGGFVRIKGESGQNAGDPDAFASKPAWQRLIVLVAGVGMNLLLAWVLLSVGFMVGLPSIVDGTTPPGAIVRERSISVMTVLPGAPAERAGVAAGDVIVSIDGKSFESAEEARAAIAASSESGMDLTVRRPNGDMATIHLAAENLVEAQVRGIGVGMLDTGIVSFGPLMAVWQGAIATVSSTWEVTKAFGTLLSDLVLTQKVSAELSGPVGIAVMTGQAAALGIVYLIQFAALLSINLAVLNVLPFPALDGGRILFLVIEKLRGRSVDRNLEAIVHNLGFAFLMVLVVLVTYQDFARFGGAMWNTLKSFVGA